MNLKESDVEGLDAVPCCTILLRLLNPETDSVPRPFHKNGYYMGDTQPFPLENKFFKHYFEINDYQDTLENVGGSFKNLVESDMMSE